MNSAALIIAEALLKFGPALARGLMELFAKPEPTAADWEKIFQLAEKSYEEYTKKP